MSRKDRLRRNLGGTVEEEYKADPFFEGPILTAARVSVVMIERIILAILRTEVDRLSTDASELTRYFHHIYDPTISEAERKAFESNFTSSPPVTVLGYPRVTTDLPCFAVVLEADEESDSMLGKYVGETLEGENATEDAMYEGAVFDQTYGIYIYSQHPDVCAYLYQFCKLVLFGAREALEAAGVMDPSYSGAVLSPEEVYMPDNVFARVLRIRAKSVMTIPRLFSYTDARRLRVTGIFREDVVVDGVPGGVDTYEEE